MLTTMKAKYLVADTAAFVKNVPFWELGEEVFSLPEVMEEIRDRQTKQRVEALPVTVTMRQPQPHSIRFVNEFSKKTGDYSSLSLADIKVLALTYELEVEARGGSEHLRSEPQKIMTEWAGKRIHPTTQSDTKDVIEVTEPSEQPPGQMPETEELSDTRRISHHHLQGLNAFLRDHSYVSGHIPTTADLILLTALLHDFPQFTLAHDKPSDRTSEDCNVIPNEHSFPLVTTYPHIQRWAAHMASFAGEEGTLSRCTQQQLAEFLPGCDSREDASCTTPHDESGLSCPVETDVWECVLGEGQESDAADEGVECAMEDEEETQQQQQQQQQQESDSLNEGSCEESEDEDDDGGWITPSNIKRHKMKAGLLTGEEEEELEGEVLVACITSDFAMQNVLKHVGLTVMGVDGKLIRQIKTFILRCHACFKTTSVMTKLFCPHCGNKTLKKVSVTVNPDGSQQIWINSKKRISTRGMKYSLPTPKGGKHGRNPLLVEDQREAKRFSSKMSSKKVNPLHQDYDPDQLPFAVRDVFSRAAQLGYIGGRNHHHHYWEKRNPNEPQRKTGNKKKN